MDDGRQVHYVFSPDHYIGIVIANTTSLYKYCAGTRLCFGFCPSHELTIAIATCSDTVHTTGTTFSPDHYIGIVIANTTSLYKYCAGTRLCFGFCPSHELTIAIATCSDTVHTTGTT